MGAAAARALAARFPWPALPARLPACVSAVPISQAAVTAGRIPALQGASAGRGGPGTGLHGQWPGALGCHARKTSSAASAPPSQSPLDTGSWERVPGLLSGGHTQMQRPPLQDVGSEPVFSGEAGPGWAASFVVERAARAASPRAARRCVRWDERLAQRCWSCWGVLPCSYAMKPAKPLQKQGTPALSSDRVAVLCLSEVTVFEVQWRLPGLG